MYVHAKFHSAAVSRDGDIKGNPKVAKTVKQIKVDYFFLIWQKLPIHGYTRYCHVI